MNLQDLQPETVDGFTVSAERKKINLVYLDLLREFERLCAQHNITWWVCYGTLLGAVRHKGFIPWDDDVDIMMPRRDFDRLARMTQREFGAEEPYFLQSPKTDPSYTDYLLRFRRSDTTSIQDYDVQFLQAHKKKTPYNLGLNLSIFPMDDCPDSAAVFGLRKKLAWILMGIDYRAEQPAEEKPLSHAICACARAVLGPKFFIRSVAALFRVNNPDSENVHSMDGFYPIPHLWPRKDYAETVRLPFEDTSVPVPVGWDSQLRGYGADYMQLPPQEMRTEKHDAYMNADIPYMDVLASPELLADVCGRVCAKTH